MEMRLYNFLVKKLESDILIDYSENSKQWVQYVSWWVCAHVQVCVCMCAWVCLRVFACTCL